MKSGLSSLPYLTLMTEDAPPRVYDLREVYNGLRYMARTGAPWRWLPTDLPPWPVVYQQTQRWLKSEVFQAMVQDLREILRMAQGRNAEPIAVILDSRTMQATPESGARAGYDGAKRRKGSKVHVVGDTLAHLLALHVTRRTGRRWKSLPSKCGKLRETTCNWCM